MPELPTKVPWLNALRRPRIADVLADGPALVHFLDFAQLNSVRALPYLVAWRARYAGAGLTVLGIHSPRFGFTADRRKLAAALDRLGVEHPVALDSSYEIWSDYGCRGWPSLFLWSRDGALRWAHFGEGEYAATEEAIQAELREAEPLRDLPLPLDPLRPSDAPGAKVMPPSDEVFPGGSRSEPWRGGGRALETAYAAGGAYASIDGEGELRVATDGAEARTIGVDVPGLYELDVHARHEAHELRLEADGGIEIYSLSFAAGTP